MWDEKVRRRLRRNATRKNKVACPCGKPGCETGRGHRIPPSILKRREVRRGGVAVD